jgi:radical SAM superfamily enzyme YgiQ (UPF0313 family)
MRAFLIHVRDPQFYAIPRQRRSPHGRLQVMGFPPIGIMSLSSVLKRAGHEVTMFDQANPETPNDVIIEEMRRQKPDLVGMSFLSTTSYPYAKMLARQLRAADAHVKLAFGGVFATLNAPLVKAQCKEVDFVCRGDGEQLIVDLLEHLNDPDTVTGVTWQEKDGTLRNNPNRALPRDLDQWPFPDRESLALDFVESMPLDVPAVLSLDRFTTMQTSRGCPWPCVFCDIPIFNEGKWRSRSPQHVIDEFRELQQQGYGAVYFVDDHFLLQPKRIEAICTGIVAAGVTIQWGCEGRVDSTAQHLFPNMAAAHCRTLMFGIESGSQAVLDRLKKEQTLAEVETAVTNAKQAGIKIVHGFFVVGTPGETVEDMRATFDFAARLRLDTFGFNRLCVYRGTPLWQEYVQRGLVDDTDDWYKYFKCSEIDPTCLPGAVINAERAAGLRRLFGYKLTHYPLQTLRPLRRFQRHMPVRDVLYLIVKPFLGSQQGPTTNEVLSRAVEHASVKDAAARLTQVPDAVLERVGTASRAERLRLRQDASPG